ncbi:3-oxosteroid 1-dehydrogenase [Bacilli bacterium PM5-3]|nr:3-oxosteroid 1-dehydrogenase [Bacilli bacterium PM5-3]MDH6603595.1 3-oxosteroid 1-dehydrogenase [Bacilli bacterium PM5-9]
MKLFRCKVCGHIHKGDTPPDICPVCRSPKEKFELVENEDEDKSQHYDDDHCDVVVVGSGASALVAAITLHLNGFNPIVVEKANKLGGTTARSGGRYWIPNNKHQKDANIIDNKDDCLAYMVRYSYPEKFNSEKKYFGIKKEQFDLLETYYDKAPEMIEFLEENKILETAMDYSWKRKPYPDYMDHLKENKGIRGRTLYTKTSSGPASMGSDLIDILTDYLEKNNIKTMLNSRVIDIIKDSDKVVGVKVDSKGKELTISSNYGVIFATGGFSHNSDLITRFQPATYYGGCSVPENTGDLVSIAEKHRIKLGNMNNAFKAQSILDMYLKNPDASSSLFYLIGDSILLVNKYGERLMNEKRNYNDRTMKHFVWDENNAEWPNRLMYLIFDSRVANLWRGFPPIPMNNIEDSSYILKGKTFKELTKEIRKYVDSIKDEVENYSLSNDFEDGLCKTIIEFNEYAKNGVDEKFHRGSFDYDCEYTTFSPTVPDVEWPPKDSKNITMYPFSDEGPYYAIVLAAGTLDTNGGPIINNHAQMIGFDDKSIDGLYGAGNCIASITRNAYWGAGSTIGPGMTYGYIAALDIIKKHKK